MLKAAGWDIGCHTMNHPHLDELSQCKVCEEMIAVNEAFKANNLEPPDHHAYPFTDYSELVVKAVSNYRLTARRGEYPDFHFSWQDPNWLALPALRIYIKEEQCLQRVKEQVDQACNEKRLLFLYTHRISEEAGPYDTNPAYFAELLDYIVEREIRTATISEVYSLYYLEGIE